MKRKLLIFAFVASLLGLSTPSTFGQQGAAVFGAGINTIKDQTFMPPNPSNFKVSFLWGTGIPMIDSIAIRTPTNLPPPLSFDRSLAWNLILNDPNFRLGVDLASNLTVVADVLLTGGWSYRTNGGFLVADTISGQT